MRKKKLFLYVLAVIIVFAVVGAGAWYQYFRPTDNSLANIKKKGVLVVGSDIPYGMMEFFDANNQPAGIDVDIAAEIADSLGVKLEFRDYDWDQLFSKVKSGDIDLAISSITITPERQQEMLFSHPYFNGGQVIIVRSDEEDIQGVLGLAEKKVATQENTTGYTEAKKYVSDSDIITYLNFDKVEGGPSILDDLEARKFDAIIVDYVQALDIIKNYSGVKIVGVPFTKESYGIATKIGNDSLIKQVNYILKRLKNSGGLEEINSQWITL